MPESPLFSRSVPVTQRPWDARLARRLVTPLKDSRATPNHLTTVRLAFGLASAAAFLPGTYGLVSAASNGTPAYHALI
jgi:archaetidylinositol phosphate synthase